jgi:hypothetical protein
MQKHRKHHGDYHSKDSDRHDRMDLALSVANKTTNTIAAQPGAGDIIAWT